MTMTIRLYAVPKLAMAGALLRKEEMDKMKNK
jgi:hypothetical protein